MKELRKMTIEFKDFKVQKRDANRKCAQYTEKIEIYNRNNDRLNQIKTKLQKMTKPEDKHKWPASIFLKPGDKQFRYTNTDSFWLSFQFFADSDLSRVDIFRREKMKRTRALSDFHFDLISESNLILCDGNRRIESYISEVEKKYEEVKQGNDKLSSPDNTTVRKCLNKIEYLIQNIENCIKDMAEEKYLLENSEKVLTDTIKVQTELIYEIEKRVLSLSFLLDPEKGIAKRSEIV